MHHTHAKRHSTAWRHFRHRRRNGAKIIIAVLFVVVIILLSIAIPLYLLANPV